MGFLEFFTSIIDNQLIAAQSALDLVVDDGKRPTKTAKTPDARIQLLLNLSKHWADYSDVSSWEELEWKEAWERIDERIKGDKAALENVKLMFMDMGFREKQAKLLVKQLYTGGAEASALKQDLFAFWSSYTELKNEYVADFKNKEDAEEGINVITKMASAYTQFRMKAMTLLDLKSDIVGIETDYIQEQRVAQENEVVRHVLRACGKTFNVESVMPQVVAEQARLKAIRNKEPEEKKVGKYPYLKGNPSDVKRTHTRTQSRDYRELSAVQE